MNANAKTQRQKHLHDLTAEYIINCNCNVETQPNEEIYNLSFEYHLRTMTRKEMGKLNRFFFHVI